MSHQNSFPLSDELRDAFSKAKGQSQVRYLQFGIKNEKLELLHTGKASTSSIDFNGIPNILKEDSPCYIVFRYKDTFASSPWALIAFIPDTCDVKDRMTYAASFGGVKSSLGPTNISKVKRFSTKAEFVWKEFENSPSDELEDSTPKSSVPRANNSTSNLPTKPDMSLPWNKRELATFQLMEEDAKAIQEFEEFAKKKPTEASGFHLVTLPLTPEAEDAICNLKSGQFNWIQLTLDDQFKTIGKKVTKTVQSNNLASHIDSSEPQFYLYDKDGIIVLIYCCPERGTTTKNRMVYSTCKASFADAIQNLGVGEVKKFDIREPSELTESALNQHLRSNAASLFKPNNKIMNPSTSHTAPLPKRTQKSTPLGAVALPKAPSNNSTPSLASLMTKGNSPLPKKVVLPPSGAYC